MKGKHFFKSCVAIVATFVIVSVAHAAVYSEVQLNASDGYDDGGYAGGVLSWDVASPHTPTVSLITDEGNLGAPPVGFTRSIEYHVTSNFQDYNSTLTGPARAYFTGGSVSLTFEHATSPAGPWTAYELSGPIAEASVEITSIDAQNQTSWLTGILQFDTRTVSGGVANLPGSLMPAVWPASGLSSGISLTWSIGQDLTGFDWSTDINPSVLWDTQVAFRPEEVPIPEPGTLLLGLLGIGGFVATRPRRKES